MGNDMFDISDDAWGEPLEAVKEFTDRENPQEAFERKFRVFRDNWRRTYYVLAYYGIGGVGKTSFVNKLCRVIRRVEGNELRLLDKIDCSYIRYDFDSVKSGTDKLSILLSFRKQLQEQDKEFKFFRFDSAVLLYGKKTGNDLEKDEMTKTILEGNPWLDTLVSTVGALPVVGWVSNVIQAIDKSSAIVRESVGRQMDETRYRQHLNEINCLEPSELLGKLHEYFILDMRYNMQQIAKKPVIVFLDTYEKYIDTLNREVKTITDDFWLRKGSRSVIRSIPGLLWVITGREKLYWEEDDDWGEVISERPLDQLSEEEKEEIAKQHLEQHLLGDLSRKDAIGFLKKAGIVDDVLCDLLYRLTSGTPLFLDICVDTYHELSRRGEVPDIGMFGEDLTGLVSRYLSNMNESNREMAYFLAGLGSWNDEQVFELAQKTTVLRWFSRTRYEEFINHSFIIRNLDGSYYMHETVRNAAVKNADREIFEEISRLKQSMLREHVETDHSLDSNVVFAEFVDSLTQGRCSYDDFYQSLKTIREKLKALTQAGDQAFLLSVTEKLYRTASRRFPRTGVDYLVRSEYAQALRIKGDYKEAYRIVSSIPLEKVPDKLEELEWITVKEYVSTVFFYSGMHRQSFELDKSVCEARERILGPEHPDTLTAQSNLASSYSQMGDKRKALELREHVLTYRKRILGEEHPDTIKSMGILAISYSNVGRDQEALELRRHVYEVTLRAFGEEHPSSLSAMSSFADSLEDVGEYEKALELYRQSLALKRKLLGEHHPQTFTTMNNMAILYDDIGQPEKALELKQQVLEGRIEHLGEEHPDTINAMNGLAYSYAGINNLQKALELTEQVLKLRRKVLGEEHLDTISSMASLAYYYSKLHRYQETKLLEEKALEVRMRILGAEHKDTISLARNLAITYDTLGEYRKSYPLWEQVVSYRRKTLGDTHRDTLSAMDGLAKSYEKAGENTKALEVMKKLRELSSGQSSFRSTSYKNYSKLIKK